MKVAISEVDENLMRDNLEKTLTSQVTGIRTSCEHYRYLAEQIISLRRLVKLQRAYLQREECQ